MRIRIKRLRSSAWAVGEHPLVKASVEFSLIRSRQLTKLAIKFSFSFRFFRPRTAGHEPV